MSKGEIPDLVSITDRRSKRHLLRFVEGQISIPSGREAREFLATQKGLARHHSVAMGQIRRVNLHIPSCTCVDCVDCVDSNNLRYR